MFLSAKNMDAAATKADDHCRRRRFVTFIILPAAQEEGDPATIVAAGGTRSRIAST